MNISKKGLELIKSFEGCRLYAYKCVPSEQYYTIGYGHYGADVKPDMIITPARADELLKQDLKKFEAKVDKYMPIYHFNQAQYDAMVSFAYNVGSIDQLTAYGNRTLAQIAEMLPAYNKSGGKVLPGLTKRRLNEQALFLSEDIAKPVLKKGIRGSYVTTAQNLLKAAGYLDKVDGIFGPKTEEAVKALQADRGITVDGIIGKDTWRELDK